jgi:hypothetical protein
MNKMSDYAGGFFNHMEGIYRAEDRALAIELAQGLGLTVSEIQFTAKSRPLIALHPNAEDRDPTNNVFFLYEMPEVQRRLVDLLKHRVDIDSELRKAMETYREAAAKAPPIMPHFGLRYRSPQALQAVMDQLEHGMSAELKSRVSVWEVPPYKPVDGLPDIRQVFVRTDVFFVGAAPFEQAIELQVVRPQ